MTADGTSAPEGIRPEGAHTPYSGKPATIEGVKPSFARAGERIPGLGRIARAVANRHEQFRAYHEVGHAAGQETKKEVKVGRLLEDRPLSFFHREQRLASRREEELRNAQELGISVSLYGEKGEPLLLNTKGESANPADVQTQKVLESIQIALARDVARQAAMDGIFHRDTRTGQLISERLHPEIHAVRQADGDYLISVVTHDGTSKEVSYDPTTGKLMFHPSEGGNSVHEAHVASYRYHPLQNENGEYNPASDALYSLQDGNGRQRSELIGRSVHRTAAGREQALLANMTRGVQEDIALNYTDVIMVNYPDNPEHPAEEGSVVLVAGKDYRSEIARDSHGLAKPGEVMHTAARTVKEQNVPWDGGMVVFGDERGLEAIGTDGQIKIDGARDRWTFGINDERIEDQNALRNPEISEFTQVQLDQVVLNQYQQLTTRQQEEFRRTQLGENLAANPPIRVEVVARVLKPNAEQVPAGTVPEHFEEAMRMRIQRESWEAAIKAGKGLPDEATTDPAALAFAVNPNVWQNGILEADQALTTLQDDIADNADALSTPAQRAEYALNFLRKTLTTEGSPEREKAVRELVQKIYPSNEGPLVLERVRILTRDVEHHESRSAFAQRLREQLTAGLGEEAKDDVEALVDARMRRLELTDEDRRLVRADAEIAFDDCTNREDAEAKILEQFKDHPDPKVEAEWRKILEKRFVLPLPDVTAEQFMRDPQSYLERLPYGEVLAFEAAMSPVQSPSLEQRMAVEQYRRLQLQNDLLERQLSSGAPVAGINDGTDNGATEIDQMRNVANPSQTQVPSE